MSELRKSLEILMRQKPAKPTVVAVGAEAMTPEQVAEYLTVDRLNPAYANAVRDLIAERDRLRAALVEIYGKACLYKMMDAGSEEVAELAVVARAALEQNP